LRHLKYQACLNECDGATRRRIKNLNLIVDAWLREEDVTRMSTIGERGDSALTVCEPRPATFLFERNRVAYAFRIG
jgi:hypothetical protein